MVFAGSIEKFLIVMVTRIVVFGKFDMEIRNPSHLSCDISLLSHYRTVRHSRSLHFVLFIWIKLSLRHVCNILMVSKRLVEVFLKVLTT